MSRASARPARPRARDWGCGILAAALAWLAPGSASAAAPRHVVPTPPVYGFEIRKDFLTTKDGVRLAATFFLPKPKSKGERFPVLFEFLPYRKDDSFYLRDYPLYAYFARRGFACAKLDLRGTGSSEGAAPDREYSEQELDDAVEAIAQLARMPWSNGSVGMWGISWGGFNAIQVAMRQPPELKAILAAHASDDLYRDSVDFIDGVFHMDAYHLEIHHENGLPRPPDYALDDAYFRDRFERRPWIFEYLKHQQDGAFWRKSALAVDYSKLRVPVYLIGGLLDGYRDAVPRILENASAPVQAEIGPWNHAWPNDGEPGPNYEWGYEATKWWDHWLRGKDTDVSTGKRFAVFVRDAHAPDAALKQTPGRWRVEDWPIARTQWRRLYPAADGSLLASAPPAASRDLRYVPSHGVAAGLWWGEPTGDMRPDDAGSLVFDSEPLAESVEIVGFPKVRLRVSADAPLADWIARLEDVHPDGRVSLVAAAALNGAQRDDPLRPAPLVPGRAYDVAFDLHFTTWTFPAAHRIRLAVTNAQFPMLWPTPYPMTTRLELGASSSLSLPAIPFEDRPAPAFRAPEPREERPDAKYLDCSAWPDGKQEITRDLVRGETRYEWASQCGYEIGDRRYRVSERNRYATRDGAPAESSFRGDETHRIELPGRSVELRSVLEVRSDEKSFAVVFTRRILENERLVRERQWAETIPRELQ